MSVSALRRRPGTSSFYEDEGLPSRKASRRRPQPTNVAPLIAALIGFAIFTAGGAIAVLTHKSSLSSEAATAQQNIELKVYSPDELSKYTGKWHGRVLLACMGKVFDVTPGKKHYGPGAGYSVFAGKDASRSFVTGAFKTESDDNVENFTAEEFAGLLHWREFYEQHKEYTLKGVVVGRFYDKKGNATPLVQHAETLAAEHRAMQAAEEASQAPKPEVLCNVSWKKESGGWVHCAEGMVPRRLAAPNEIDGIVKERCVCISEGVVEEGEGMRMYDGCAEKSRRCQTSLPE